MNLKRRSFVQIVWLVLSVLCILYGIAILSIASGTRFFMVWFLLAAFFGCLFLASRAQLWSRLPVRVKAVILIILIVCAVLFAVIEGIIAKGFAEKGEKGLDYLIVLGAQVRENGPSQVLRYRLDTAYDYLVENEKTLCIVSGGQGPNEPCTEAEGMKTYLIERGIGEDRIIMEPDSLTTGQNIENSKMLLDPPDASVGIVTNDFHVFRGSAIAKKAGLQAVGIAAPSSPPYLPNNMLREFFGVVKDFLQGNL